VVDVSDREPQNGELFLIQRASGARSRHIRQLKSDLLNITGSGRAKSLVWWISDLVGFRPILESISGIPVFGESSNPGRTNEILRGIIGR
jgi:hypothetical protein